MNTKTKLLVGGVSILAVVVILVLFSDQLKRGFGEVSPSKEAAKPSLSKMVEAAGKKVGTMVDSVTRLDRVSQGSANQMVSEYTMVNIPTKQAMDPKADLSAVKEKIRARACEVPDVKQIVANDVTIVYRYRAVNGDLLIEVELTKANCKA